MERQRGKVLRAPHKKQITNRRRPGAVFGADNPYMKERDTEALDRKKVIRARIRKSHEGRLGGPLAAVGEHPARRVSDPRRDSELQPEMVDFILS